MDEACVHVRFVVVLQTRLRYQRQVVGCVLQVVGTLSRLS